MSWGRSTTMNRLLQTPPSPTHLRSHTVRRRLFFGILLGVAGTLHGQIVAWDVINQNSSATNPLSASILDGRLTSASLTLGSGVGASAAGSTFGGSGFDQTSLAAALSGGDYLSFSLTPASGSSFSVSSMSLLFGVSTAVTNFNVALVSNVSGFTAENALWNFAFGTASPAMQTITLSSVPDLQNLTSVVEFRLYGWRDTSGTTTFRIRENAGNDLSVLGTATAIPEPSTYAALFGAGGLVLAAGARWRMRNR